MKSSLVNKFALPLLTLAGLALVGWLWWADQQSGERAEKAREMLDLAEQLAYREGRIREQILRLRHGLNTNYDALSSLVRGNGQLLKQLAPLPQNQDLKEAWIKYSEQHALQSEQVERFKTYNAQIRNSLRYFQHDVFRFMEELPKTPGAEVLRGQLIYLASGVLRRSLGGNDNPASQGTDIQRNDLIALAWSLKVHGSNLAPLEQAGLDRLIQHNNLIDRYLHKLESLTQALLGAENPRQLSRIAQMARDGIQAETQVASRYRLGLSLLSGILLLALTALALRFWENLRQMARQRRFLQGLTDNAGAGVLVLDDRDQIVFANPHAVALLGYDHNSLLHMRMHEGVHVHADGEPVTREACQVMRRAREGMNYSCEELFKRADGKIIPVMLNSGVLVDKDGSQTVLVFQDISEQKRQVHELSLAERIFESSQQGVVITDVAGTIQRVNPAYCRITGYTEEELIGQNPRILKSGQQSPAFYTEMWRQLTTMGSWQGEMRSRRKNGDVFVQWVHIDAVSMPDGTVRYAGIVSDITEVYENRERLTVLAYYDTLTGLPNRTLFRDRLNQAMIQARREHKSLALMFADLDNFKGINDSLGHAAGDELLKEVAVRLKGGVRESDTVARLGGDEFALLLQDPGSVVDVGLIASDIIDRVNQPAHILEYEVVSSTSVGVTLYPQDADTPEQLLRNADVAMYRAKEQGKNTFQFFTSDMATGALEAMRIETALHRALDANEFSLFYQPQFQLGGRPVGAEALLRWESQGMGQVSPGVFIPVAEKCGLIAAIGNWVLRQACSQCQSWRETIAPDLKVAVNLSVVQFKQPDLAERVAAVLEETGLPGSALELEITESVVMEDVGRGLAVLVALKALGCTLAIDDFGTGYSSLSYLKRLPVDVLKIDKSFIDGLGTDPHDTAVAGAIISLARSLDLLIVAEGVETAGQYVALSQLQGDARIQAQGYHLSRPLSVAAYEDFLRAWHLSAQVA